MASFDEAFQVPLTGEVVNDFQSSEVNKPLRGSYDKMFVSTTMTKRSDMNVVTTHKFKSVGTSDLNMYK